MKHFDKLNAYVKDIKPGNKVDIDTALLNHRIIYFHRQVNSNTCSDIIKYLLFLSKESKDEVQLFINTPGGSINDAFAVINIINKIPCDVRTIGIGQVYSAGVILISGGTKGKRTCLEDTNFLIHQPLQGVEKGHIKLSDLKITTHQLSKAQDKIIEYLLNRTKLKRKQLLELSKEDSFFGAKKALEYGLIDYINSKNETKKTV